MSNTWPRIPNTLSATESEEECSKFSPVKIILLKYSCFFDERQFQAVDVPFHLILRTHFSLQSPCDSNPSKDPDHGFESLGNSKSVCAWSGSILLPLSSPLLQCSTILACRERRVTNVCFWGWNGIFWNGKVMQAESPGQSFIKRKRDNPAGFCWFFLLKALYGCTDRKTLHWLQLAP